MPLTCSCRNALIRAIAVRIRRLASRTRFRKKYVSRIMNGSGEKVASASIACHLNKTTAIANSSTKSFNIATTPEANRSFSASTSVVERVTSRPIGLRSKKLIGKRCRCSKISLRRSYIVSCPTHCMIRTCTYCSPKLARIEPAYAAATHTSPKTAAVRAILPSKPGMM